MSNQTNFQAVTEFCKVFGHPTPSTLQKDIIERDPKLMQFRLSLIEEEVKELKEAIRTNNMTEFADALGDILYVVYGAGVAVGLDLDRVFKIVHESNMSKLCRTEQEAIETLAHYKTLPGFENTNVQYRPSTDGKYFVIYNAETGKILKSKYFNLPDFKEIIEA